MPTISERRRSQDRDVQVTAVGACAAKELLKPYACCNHAAIQKAMGEARGA